MLEINDLCFSYGARSKKAVDELKLKVEPGNICALLGPNGAGKTTIIKLILGLLKADAGSVRIDGKDIYSDSVSYKASIGYVSDEQDIYNNLTGKEYLEFIADAYKVSTEERKVIYERLLNLFHMQNRLNEKMKNYSHGMKQKISIIASLVHTPDIWILDEPMTGLDVESNIILKKLIKAHAKSGKAVLFSTHILEVCEKLCNDIVIIKDGKMIYHEKVTDPEVYRVQSLEQLFLEVTNK